MPIDRTNVMLSQNRRSYLPSRLTSNVLNLYSLKTTFSYLYSLCSIRRRRKCERKCKKTVRLKDFYCATLRAFSKCAESDRNILSHVLGYRNDARRQWSGSYSRVHRYIFSGPRVTVVAVLSLSVLLRPTGERRLYFFFGVVRARRGTLHEVAHARRQWTAIVLRLIQ